MKPRKYGAFCPQHAARAYPKLLLQAKLYLTLQTKYIEECGPCDHAVNICVCGLIAEAEDTAALLRSLGEVA